MRRWKEIFGKFFAREKAKAPKYGRWKEFNKQAVLVSEGSYERDLKDGLWKQYYETGELLIEEMYDRGVLHGRFASYHANGRLLSEGKYRQGHREGYFHVYDESGRQVKSLLFVNNILVEEIDTSRLPSPAERAMAGR